MTDVFEKLKTIIDREGFDYLKDRPYEVFKELEGRTVEERSMSATLFSALVMNIPSEAEKAEDPAYLTKTIQRKCKFNKSRSEQIATGFIELFSKKNTDRWKGMELSGLDEYLGGTHKALWNGFAVWECDTGTVDCIYNAEIVVQPTEAIRKEEELLKRLKKNPFLQMNIIDEFFSQSLTDYLDRKFEDYCTCDDYYQPVVEDFEIDYYAKEWCAKHGFILLSCIGTGYDKGYEPKSMKW